MDVNGALSRLCSLRLTKMCDWLMEPGRGDRLDLPEVQAMLRDVLELSSWRMGHDVPQGERSPAALNRQSDATRTMLLLRWATDPAYADSEES